MSEPSPDPIADVYGRHPYPPPVVDIDADADAWSDGVRRRVEHFRMWPTEPHRGISTSSLPDAARLRP